MFDPRYQHGTHTPLCGHAHWRTNPTAQIDFIAADREKERKSTLWKIHSTLWRTSGNPFWGKSSGGGRERKHASSNCVCWLGGYKIDRVSLILLRRSQSSRTDLSTVVTAVHRRHTWAQSPTPRRQAGVKLEPHTSCCSPRTCSSLLRSFSCTSAVLSPPPHQRWNM